MFQRLPTQHPNRILCYYMNPTHKIQVARLVNIPNFRSECVVFSQQRFYFEAIPKAYLEIYTERLGVPSLAAQISCNLLRVQEDLKDGKIAV